MPSPTFISSHQFPQLPSTLFPPTCLYYAIYTCTHIPREIKGSASRKRSSCCRGQWEDLPFSLISSGGDGLILKDGWGLGHCVLLWVWHVFATCEFYAGLFSRAVSMREKSQHHWETLSLTCNGVGVGRSGDLLESWKC